MAFSGISIRYWPLIATLCLCSGCVNVAVEKRSSSVVEHRTERPATPVDWIRTELYFGRVREEDWKHFLDTQITPRFPSGLTLLEGQGQWRAKDGIIHAVPTRILVILHPNDVETDRSLEEIRRAYTTAFHHESVLRSDSPAKVRF